MGYILAIWLMTNTSSLLVFSRDFKLLTLCYIVPFLSSGEGFHNYHHTFPYDYATSEFGMKLNLTTCFIDLMCFLGLATDRKRASRDIVQARAQRTGDASVRSG